MRGDCCLCNAQDTLVPMWFSFSRGKGTGLQESSWKLQPVSPQLGLLCRQRKHSVVFKECFITSPQDWGSFFEDEHPQPCSAFSSRRLALPPCPQEWQPTAQSFTPIVLSQHLPVPLQLTHCPHCPIICVGEECAFLVALWQPPGIPTCPPGLAELLPHGPVVLLVFWLPKCVDFEWLPQSYLLHNLGYFQCIPLPNWRYFRTLYIKLWWQYVDNREREVLK